MRNLEGIKNVEVNEKKLEESSMVTNDNASASSIDNYDDCIKTIEDQKEELQSLKDEIMYYEQHCQKQTTEIIQDDYEDCRKM